MTVIGIDEVGRGAWAGPLMISAVRFIDEPSLKLNDSKKMTKIMRERAALEIIACSEWASVSYSSNEVDRLGLTECLRRGALRLMTCMTSENDIIIDGNYNFLVGTPYESRTKTVIKADALYPEVMAASILAKVARDAYMARLDSFVSLAGYGFASHVGYGTKMHQKSLEELGVSSVHRLSFKPIQLLGAN